MTQPAVSDSTERLYDKVRPLAWADEDNGWALLYLCEAGASMVDELADIFADTDDGQPGWTTLLDPDLCPENWIDFAAGNFYGIDFEPGLTVGQKRTKWRESAGRKRGRPAAIKGAAKPYLVGPDGTSDTATVTVYEHVDGSPYRYLVITYTAETAPDANVGLVESTYATVADFEAAYTSVGQLETKLSPVADALADALMRAKPGGYVFEHRIDDGWSVGQLEAAYDGQTIADLTGDYSTVGELETVIPDG